MKPTVIVALILAVGVLAIGSRAGAQSEPKPGPWGAKSEAKAIASIERALKQTEHPACLSWLAWDTSQRRTLHSDGSRSGPSVGEKVRGTVETQGSV